MGLLPAPPYDPAQSDVMTDNGMQGEEGGGQQGGQHGAQQQALGLCKCCFAIETRRQSRAYCTKGDLSARRQLGQQRPLLQRGELANLHRLW